MSEKKNEIRKKNHKRHDLANDQGIRGKSKKKKKEGGGCEVVE